MPELKPWLEWKLEDVAKKAITERNEYIKGYYEGQRDLIAMVLNNFKVEA